MQGKSDFEAIENFRGDAFYKQALGIGLLLSSPPLRQRMHTRVAELFDFIALLKRCAVEQLASGLRCAAMRVVAAGRGHLCDGQRQHSRGRRGPHLFRCRR